MRITRIFIAVLAVSVSFGLVGCAKAPAEQALKAAEEAMAAAQADVQPYVPDRWNMLTDAMESARNDFEKGSYKPALDAAKAIPAQVDEAKTMAQARKDELGMFWQQMGANMPAMLSTMSAKIGEGKVPAGMTKDEAKAEAAALTGMWAQADAAFQAGQVLEATKMGAEVQGRTEKMLTGMGIKAGVLPAPGQPAASGAPAGGTPPTP